jgi:hypothetical protein
MFQSSCNTNVSDRYICIVTRAGGKWNRKITDKGKIMELERQGLNGFFL